jgi:hypothetical protein
MIVTPIVPKGDAPAPCHAFESALGPKPSPHIGILGESSCIHGKLVVLEFVLLLRNPHFIFNSTL